MQPVTVQKSIIFKTNDCCNTPEAVRLTFTPETLHRIATIQSLVKQYDLFSAKIEIMDEFTLLDEDGNEANEWFTREGTFVMYQERFYFYAQSKWDSSDQIESEEMDVIKIMGMFPIGQQTQPKPLPEPLPEREAVEGEDKSIYFLFGNDACRVYSEDGIEALEEFINSGEGYELYEYTGDIADLLGHYSGWEDYQFLTPEEYETLSDL